VNPGFSKASDDFPDISPKLETVAALLVVLGFVIVQNDQDSSLLCFHCKKSTQFVWTSNFSLSFVIIIII